MEMDAVGTNTDDADATRDTTVKDTVTNDTDSIICNTTVIRFDSNGTTVDTTVTNETDDTTNTNDTTNSSQVPLDYESGLKNHLMGHCDHLILIIVLAVVFSIYYGCGAFDCIIQAEQDIM